MDSVSWLVSRRQQGHRGAAVAPSVSPFLKRRGEAGAQKTCPQRSTSVGWNKMSAQMGHWRLEKVQGGGEPFPGVARLAGDGGVQGVGVSMRGQAQGRGGKGRAGFSHWGNFPNNCLPSIHFPHIPPPRPHATRHPPAKTREFPYPGLLRRPPSDARTHDDSPGTPRRRRPMISSRCTRRSPRIDPPTPPHPLLDPPCSFFLLALAPHCSFADFSRFLGAARSTGMRPGGSPPRPSVGISCPPRGSPRFLVSRSGLAAPLRGDAQEAPADV